MTTGRILAGICGVGVLAAFMLPFYRLDLGSHGAFEVSLNAVLEGSGDIQAYSRMVMTDPPAGSVTSWILLGAYLVAGPVYLAYVGVRMVFWAVSGSHCGHIASAMIVISYVVIGWGVIDVFPDTVSIPVSYWEMTASGLWLAVSAVISGSIIREVMRD